MNLDETRESEFNFLLKFSIILENLCNEKNDIVDSTAIDVVERDFANSMARFFIKMNGKFV